MRPQFGFVDDAGNFTLDETAPKDGTKLLVWNGYRRCLSYCDEFGWHRQNFIGEPLGAKDYEPETHWMPLPAPPEAA